MAKDTKDIAAKREEIRKMLPGSQLIAQSEYTVEQWYKVIDVLPISYLEELYGFLRMEEKIK